ncbi:MAG: transglutaminase family protein [Bacteroidota bacterium]
MNETEFNALIRLLDDDDPEIEAHIQEKLLSLGQEGIPRLETAWEQSSNEVISSRIEDLIHRIQTKDTINDLKRWREHGGGSLFKGWFLISQFRYPGMDLMQYKNEINRLVHRIWLETRAGMDLGDKLKVINRMLFGRESYRGVDQRKIEPRHYFLNQTIDHKKGTPLALGLLYLMLCDELDLPIEGIILPGYFILTYPDDQQEFYIDPYNKGNFFLRDDLKRSLKQMNVKEHERFFRPTNREEILYRMIRRIMKRFEQAKDEEWVQAYFQLLQSVFPDKID